MLHHVALLHKVLITARVDALVRLLLAVNLQVILQLIIAQEAGVAARPGALVRLGVRVRLVDVQVDVVLPLGGKVAGLVLALEELLAGVQRLVDGEAAVCLQEEEERGVSTK